MADIHAQCLHREGKLRGMIQPTTSHLKDAITVFTQPLPVFSLVVLFTHI